MVLDRRGMSSLSGQVPGIIEQPDVARVDGLKRLEPVNQRLLSVARSPYFLASQSRNNRVLRVKSSDPCRFDAQADDRAYLVFPPHVHQGRVGVAFQILSGVLAARGKHGVVIDKRAAAGLPSCDWP